MGERINYLLRLFKQTQWLMPQRRRPREEQGRQEGPIGEAQEDLTITQGWFIIDIIIEINGGKLLANGNGPLLGIYSHDLL